MIPWLRRKLFGPEPEPERSWSEAPPFGKSEITPEEVFYNASSRFLDVQISTNDVFDTRTTHAFSIGSTVLPVTFGLLRLSSTKIPSITLALLATALVMYVALLVCVWRASRIRVLEYRPNMVTLEEHSEVAPGEVLRRWVASEYVASTEFNKDRLERKGLWVGRGITALYAEGFLLSVDAISTLF